VTTIIAQLSDPHLRIGPDDEGSARALANAVEGVLALDPLPHAVLVTGDLADGGTAAEYDRFRELIAPLPMPVHVLPGNHDELDWAGPHTVDCDGLRVVLCDTQRPGRPDGHLDLDWLAAEIATPEPTIVAMHRRPRPPDCVRHARRPGRGHLREHEPAGAARDRDGLLHDRPRAAGLPRPHR
jgi:3',5'-cyclic AMP phosphodiesterase CpdA